MFTLHGLKVIEMGRWISAPYCASLLSDLGADVIKVEPPEGDPTRAFSPSSGHMSHYFSHYNSNKKSVCLDLKQEGGRESFRDLISSADIFVHNLRPGVMDRLGFGYEVVKSINPLVVYTSISGFGSGNKFSDRPAFNAVIEAESGLMDVNGGPLEGPMASGNFGTDHATGLHAAMAALSAIIGRHETGFGRHIDISMFDVALSTIGPRLTAALNGEQVSTSLGNRDSTAAPGN
ncbi:CaiB/BaiF CoA transferase family protein, partial [Glutamicibacter ardleyensis]|uniref:CaiB/BaiF CoA transferase family protein n=1 Tax=Glutamicibacter ardleyensis TaxID=225894 RepID=UPI003FD1BE3B